MNLSIDELSLPTKLPPSNKVAPSTINEETEENYGYFPPLFNLFSGFEGCEKRLVISFKSKACATNNSSLHVLTRAEWKSILEYAKCNILSIIKNSKCQAYLLSESSLFVYKTHLIIKTCGTTTLLYIIPSLITKVLSKCRMFISNIFFSRSNFMFPKKQPFIHRTFSNEVQYLNNIFMANGRAVVLGSLNRARWHCYSYSSADKSKHALHATKNKRLGKTLEIVMFDLCPIKMKCFFAPCLSSNNNKQKLEEMTNISVADKILKESGIADLLPTESIVDTYLFNPCGYSLNAILNDNYWTIHVTPEKASSFVSFETNFSECLNLNFIRKIVNTFVPSKFTIAITAFVADEVIDDTGTRFNFAKQKTKRLQHKNEYYYNEDGIAIATHSMLESYSPSTSLSSLAMKDWNFNGFYQSACSTHVCGKYERYTISSANWKSVLLEEKNDGVSDSECSVCSLRSIYSERSPSSKFSGSGSKNECMVNNNLSLSMTKLEVKEHLLALAQQVLRELKYVNSCGNGMNDEMKEANDIENELQQRIIDMHLQLANIM